MITGLRGTINSFGASRVFFEVSGVEYEVFVPLNVFEALQVVETGSELFFHIHHHYLQEEERLYGFLERNQRDFFAAIQAIKGIGSSLSLSLLSHLSGEALLALCEKKDITTLCRIPKVGKTTAETLIFEINRKIDKWRKLLDTAAPSRDGEPPVLPVIEMVTQGLLQLGYRDAQIRTVLESVRKELQQSGESESSLTFSDWMNFALRNI